MTSPLPLFIGLVALGVLFGLGVGIIAATLWASADADQGVARLGYRAAAILLGVVSACIIWGMGIVVYRSVTA